jgi:hypothetical protein
LAHLSPIFDLHLNRSRNPSEVAWSAYDFIALTQLTVDAVALSSGLDGNLGGPRPAVLAEMTLAAAAMAPGRPADEHAHVAAHILDHLLRHDEPTPYFQVGYADPDDGWQTTTQPVRVLYETLAADGSTLHVNVDHTAVALLLIATNRSLEDEHEDAIDADAAADGWYALLTNLEPGQAGPEQVFRRYKGQHAVERRYGEFKGPLAVAPLFLKTNRRITALITVICLALLIFCLAERQVRKALAPHAEMMTGLPGYGPAPARPTGRTIFQALAGLRLIPAHDGNPATIPEPGGVQARLLDLLGTDISRPRWLTP